MTWQPFHNQGLDFSLYYSIGELFPSHQGMDIYVTGEQGPWYGYSPMVAPLFSVLQWIPLKHSFDLFFFLKIFALGLWPFALANCSAQPSSSKWKYLAAGIATLVVLPAIYEETVVGNINTYLLTLMFTAFALTRYGYFFSGAAIITLIATFKPQYALFFVPALLLSPRRSILGGLLTTSILVGLSLSIYGYEGFVLLIHRWLELISIPIAAPNDANNMSTPAVVLRMLSPLALTMSGSLQNVNIASLSSETAFLIARLVAGIAVAGIVLAIFRRWKTENRDRVLDLYAGITLITFFVTPVMWLTHYTLLVIPTFAIISSQFQTHKKWIAFLVCFAAISYFLVGQMPGNAEGTMQWARTYGIPYYFLISITLLYVFSKPGAQHAA